MKVLTSEEFYSALKSNEYGQQYLQLIEKVQSENRGPKKVNDGCDKHHIHPKALGGSNRKSNLIKLTVREHCQAHAFLAEAIPCLETILPIQKMAGFYSSRIGSEEWKRTIQECGWDRLLEKARECIAERNRLKPNDPEFRRKIGVANRGRIWIHRGEEGCTVRPEELEDKLKEGWVRGRTLEQRERLKQMNQTKAKDPEFIKNLSAGCKKAHENPEYNAKISRALKGHERSEEHLEKIRANNRRKAADSEFRQKISRTLMGNICVTKDGKNRHIRPEQLPEYEKEGWRKGMDKRPRALRLEIYGEV